MRVGRGIKLATILLAAASSAAIAQDEIPEGDWRTINRDAAATRFFINDVGENATFGRVGSSTRGVSRHQR